MYPDYYQYIGIFAIFPGKNGGAAISGVVSGKLIEYGILSQTWVFKGLTLSHYDTLILFSSVMVFVLIVTLGLIPSVVKTTKAQWVPHSSKTL